MKKFTAQILPCDIRQQLIDAATFGNLHKIDAITDELAEQGICRSRTDMSKFKPLAATRPLIDTLRNLKERRIR